MICVKRRPDIGATSLGFSTMVQPVASAGPTLQAIWFMGQFHGVMKPHTPMGSRVISALLMISSNSNVRSTLRTSARCPMPAAACASLANASGAPISSEIAAAISSWCFLYVAMTLSSNSMRSLRLDRENDGNARLAAATALSTSAFSPIAMRA